MQLVGVFCFSFIPRRIPPPPALRDGIIHVRSFPRLRLSVDTNSPPFPCPRRINMPELCRNQHVSRALFHSGSVTDRQSLLTLSFSLPPPSPRTPSEAAARELAGTARPHFNGPSIISQGPRLFSLWDGGGRWS